ncbi:hypothetical protein [[Mycoplasma] anseris]|uniref:Spermidine/putrescine ABC transporter substrate-binding protein n=1 Tax=[Mycoplasma] anseris TaxID=92400 RepID=A0A2Z4NDB2_9BACT|nr:hypothetical protein [[Mycoplasma] anseris]AWX69496.1 hypothetical protein DP065_01885 [[Mycoplasma] anseris]
MNRRIWKILIFVFPVVLILLVVISFILIKSLHVYRPSIYNYESYLSPSIINKIKKKYNYKEFKEVNEFTQALNAEKAIAGVGSDFQAAQLIIDNKIKKINFELIYGEGANDWNKRKLLYRPAIVKHIENFDQLIFKTILNGNTHAKVLNIEEMTYDVDNDNVADHIYDYILPYYSQDKGIAYNINSEIRPELNVNGALEALKDQNLKLSWEDIVQKLKANNYNHFGWTNAYYDNLMIGAFYGKFKTPNVFTDQNYKTAVDKFIEFVEIETGNSIKDTKYNFTSGDGLELLSHLIEPKPNRSDAAILYNGDALDAYFSEDNYASVPSGSIKFIRPKDNYLLLDCWIISKFLSDEETAKFLKTLKTNIYQNNFASNSYEQNYKNIENIFFKQFKNELNDEIFNQELEKQLTIHKNDENFSQQAIQNDLNDFKEALKQNDLVKLLELRNHENAYFDELFSEMFANSNSGEILNFDYISYTPVDIATYDFIKNWYFAGDEIALSMYEQPESDSEYKVYPYPIIDTSLRTKIVSYYFERTKS